MQIFIRLLEMWLICASCEIIEKLSLSLFSSPCCQIYLFESDRICSCTKRWLDLLFWPQNIQSPSFDHENMKFPQKVFLFFLQISSRFARSATELEREVGLFTFATKNSRNSLQSSCRVDIHSIYLPILLSIVNLVTARVLTLYSERFENCSNVCQPAGCSWKMKGRKRSINHVSE